MPIPFGRVMSDDVCEEKAAEIVTLLKMWDVSRADAYIISRTMKYICQNANDKDWSNPLDGTGLKAEGFNALSDGSTIPLTKPEKFEFDA